VHKFVCKTAQNRLPPERRPRFVGALTTLHKPPGQPREGVTLEREENAEAATNENGGNAWI